MKKSEFLVMVQNELDTIKKIATPKEIRKLNFGTFAYNEGGSCIYGQMTGYCESPRAKMIMPKVFENVQKDNLEIDDEEDKTTYSFREQDFMPTMSNYGFTPLEKYLYMVGGAMHKKIIKYLKGEIDSINLK